MERRTVLVVEDDADCAEVLADAIAARGHRALIAADEAALRTTLERESPDLVLVDGLLRGADGIELVARLREGPLAGVDVVLHTGRPLAEVVGPARAAGIRRILPKPLALDALYEAV